jgi:hypothetical protein
MFEIQMRLILVQLALVIGNAVGDAQTPPRTCSYSSPLSTNGMGRSGG